MEVGGERVRITEMSDLLASRYAFIAGTTRASHSFPIPFRSGPLFQGAKGGEGVGVVSFPDVRTQFSFPDYRRLLTYLLHVPAYVLPGHFSIAGVFFFCAEGGDYA